MKPYPLPFLILAALLSFGVFDQTEGKETPFTGRDLWLKTNEADQLWYLKGLFDGAHLAEERPNYKKWFPKTTLGQMRQLLSDFYQNPDNADIPAPHALMIIHMERTDTPRHKIEGFKTVIRKFLERDPGNQ